MTLHNNTTHGSLQLVQRSAVRRPHTAHDNGPYGVLVEVGTLRRLTMINTQIEAAPKMGNRVIPNQVIRSSAVQTVLQCNINS